MDIILAEHMGFCGGVGRAIKMTETALSEVSAGSHVWSVGPVIHNEIVMNALKEKGLDICESLDEVPTGSTVVVRSHGESPEFFKIAAEKNIHIVDATCPKVAKIHELVEQADARGDKVVIIGDENHPEVRAIKAWGGGEKTIVLGSNEAVEPVLSALNASLNEQKQINLFVVSQTTFDKEAFESISAKIVSSNECFSVDINNTICEATMLRQQACRELAEQVDCMVVIGDKHSSNTKKLYDIAKNHGKKCAVLVENKDEISLQHLCSYGKLGLTAGASTPNHIIEEVISSMSEFRSDNYESNPMHEFMDEIDKSTRLPRNGDVVIGEVIQVTDNDVTVNLGCKKDGVIPKSEISLEEGQTLADIFKEGDEVQTKVMKNDDGEGNILLSKKRVVVSEHWETITQAYDEKTPIEVKVVREVSGGVIAMFNEVGGFIPLSQLSDRYIEKAEEFVNQTLLVKVIRLDQKRNKVVFSHKAILNEERQKRMQEIWDQLSVGDDIDGKVMRFTDYGAFIDIGGVDGLLHISEISWGKLRHPSDLLEINQPVKVKILSMNKEKEKISLGYKQNQPEPWTVINQKYQVGQVIEGKAVQIKDYGVFVEIEPGLDGLVHISEIAFRRVTDISEELDVGQVVSAKILEIDSDRKRISLSIKETLEKPSEEELAAAMEENAAVAGDPSTEAFDENKDQEFEMPDPDGVDAVEETNVAEEIADTIEEDVVAGDPSTEAVDENKDQEEEMPDPDGVDAVEEANVAEEIAETIEEDVVEGDPSTEAVDENKDQEEEMPDPDGVDAVEEEASEE